MNVTQRPYITKMTGVSPYTVLPHKVTRKVEFCYGNYATYRTNSAVYILYTALYNMIDFGRQDLLSSSQIHVYYICPAEKVSKSAVVPMYN